MWKFDSVYEMQKRLEQIDIENHEYEAWDSQGVPIELGIQKPVWLKLKPVVTGNKDQLKRALTEFAAVLGVELDPESTNKNFEDLFEQILAKEKQQKSSKGVFHHFLNRLI